MTDTSYILYTYGFPIKSSYCPLLFSYKKERKETEQMLYDNIFVSVKCALLRAFWQVWKEMRITAVLDNELDVCRNRKRSFVSFIVESGLLLFVSVKISLQERGGEASPFHSLQREGEGSLPTSL